MTFKDILYKSYVSTHITHRKGVVDDIRLRRQSIGYQQHFGNHIPDDRSVRIADLGCGYGGLVWWLLQSGFTNVKGVDGSPEQVELANKLGISNVWLGDVFSFLKEERGYSILFARDLIEHFDKQAVFDFLSNCFESLAPGGKLIIQVPNAESPYFGRVRYGDFTHELAFTSSSISQLLAAVGFSEIEVHPWRPVVAGPKSAIRYLIWRLIELFLKLPIQIESGGSNKIVTMNLISVARKPIQGK